MLRENVAFLNPTWLWYKIKFSAVKPVKQTEIQAVEK